MGVNLNNNDITNIHRLQQQRNGLIDELIDWLIDWLIDCST
jgi:hypothetical protein